MLLLGIATPALAQVTLARGGPRAPRASTWRDTTYVDAIIRLDIENGPSAVLPALTYDDKLMLPVRQFFEMVEISLPAFALRDSVLAVLQPGAVPLAFRPGQRSLAKGDLPVPYDTLDVTWWENDLFVSTGLLDRLLGVVTAVDWASLSATIGRSVNLPVVMRLRREHRRQLMGLRRPEPDVLDLALRQRVVDGAVMSWAFTASANGPSQQASLELGFGAGLLGGGAELRPVFLTGNGSSSADLRWTWWKAWPSEHGAIRQLRLGDVQSNGRRARLIQGVVATNAPFIRSQEFDVEHLVSNVPAGWEAELYEGGRLLAYADAGSAASNFRVPLDLGYGQNPFELVYYGPGGQTVRQKRTIRVPFSRLATGHLEYAVAAGRCRYDPCDALMSADARYGVSSRLTVQGGWDTYFREARGTLWQPYAIVTGALLPSLGLTGEAVVNGHARVSANYEPTLDLRVSGAFTRYAESGAAVGGTSSEQTRSEASLFWRPGWMSGSLILQGAGVVSSGPALHHDLVRLSGTARFGRYRYSLGVLRDGLRSGASPLDHRLTFDAGMDAVLSGPWRWLKQSSVQGQVALDPSVGPTAFRAIMGRRVSRALRLDGGFGWVRHSGLNLELAVSTTMPGPRASARTRTTSQQGADALLYTSGALAYDPRTRLMQLADVADLGRAGISGVLFQDDNGNGRQDPGERGLAGVPLRVGGWTAETDSTGRFAAWGMYPTEPLDIDVDTLSLGNPQLVLPAPVLRVRPSPNAFGVISVPVVVGAEVSGFVTLDGEPVAGVPVIFRDLNTDAEIRIVTFRDGGFYRGAIPPGEYEVVLPDAVLERLHASAPALSVFVPPGAGEKKFPDIFLHLERLQ